MRYSHNGERCVCTSCTSSSSYLVQTAARGYSLSYVPRYNKSDVGNRTMRSTCNALPNSELIRARCRARCLQSNRRHSMFPDTTEGAACKSDSDTGKDDPGLRGRALLDPALAQHTSVVRTPAFLSAEEIAAVRAAAAAHRHRLAQQRQRRQQQQQQQQQQQDQEPECESEEVNRMAPLYLQSGGLPPSLAPLVAKIYAHACRVDAEHWGLSSTRRRLRHPVHARCVEYHEYSAARRRCCGCHYDSGSLWTVDIMLSDVADFEGGFLITTVRAPQEAASDGGVGGTPSQLAVKETHKKHRFEQGDCLVFMSHKWHSVTPLVSGVRNVFVLEFWEGPPCFGNHRCMGKAPCGSEGGSSGNGDSSSYSDEDDGGCGACTRL